MSVIRFSDIMGSKRESYFKALDFIEDSVSGDFLHYNVNTVKEYVAELERCVRESSELTASAIELAQREAWDAARLRNEHMEMYEIETFDNWKSGLKNER